MEKLKEFFSNTIVGVPYWALAVGLVLLGWVGGFFGGKKRFRLF